MQVLSLILASFLGFGLRAPVPTLASPDTKFEPDLGTLPAEQRVFALVSKAPELHGFTVYRQIAPHVIGVIEFVDLEALLQTGGPASGKLGTWINGNTVTAGAVFAPGYWLGDPQFGCTSAPCSEPNAICTGWCSFNTWQCLCTEFKVSETARSAAARHQGRVLTNQEVWPPDA